MLDLRTLRGGMEARVDALVGHLAELPAPPVLLAHDAAALVALAAARRVAVPALVLVAPLVPGLPATHAYLWSWRLVWALLRGRAARPPEHDLARRVYADLSRAEREPLGPDDARAIAQVARRAALAGTADCPVLLLHGGADPLLPAADARRFAVRLGAEAHEVAGGGRWMMAGRSWEACVDVVHRWLVRRLGEPLLDLYEEAMAERDSPDDG